MRSIAILTAVALLTGGVGLSLAQDTDETRPDPAAAAEATQAEAPPGDEAGDDVFIPSEEVEADTAVAFPTDI